MVVESGFCIVIDRRGGAGAVRRDPGAHAPLSMSGMGVFGDRAWSERDDKPEPVGEGRGCYAIARRAGGAVTISADPFGMHPVYVHDHDGVFGVSSSSRRLVSALRGAGIRVRKSLVVHGYFVATGSGAFEYASHRDIRLLAPGEVVTISAANEVHRKRRSAASYFYSDRPVAELLDDAAHELIANVRALAARDYPEYVCDLTGGMDSRLVVAAIIASGLQDRFVFETRGSHPNPDANVAALIRQEFGLRKRAGSGGGSGGGSGDPLAKMRRSVNRTNGLMSSYFLTGGREGPDTPLHLRGGMGELMREFWSASPDGKRGPLHRLAGSIDLRPKILGAGTRKRIHRELREFGDACMEDGVRVEHVGDALYLRARTRYHFGVWWALKPNTTFNPLYNLAGVQAAHMIANEDKRDNWVGFQLMKRLSPELAAIPFADKTWAPSLVDTPAAPVTKDTPPLADVPLADSRGLSAFEAERVSRGAKRREVEFERIHAAFMEMEPDLACMAPTFDTERLSAFLNRPASAITERYGVDTAYRVMGAYLWLTS